MNGRARGQGKRRGKAQARGWLTAPRWLGVVLCLCATVMAAAFGCRPANPAEESALARVKRAGVLRWGGDIQGGEPYVYDDPRAPGHLAGFEVEIADAVARELGVRAEFVQNDWSNLVPSLERGTFDVAMNGLEVTAGRVGRVRFTRPYFVFAERLMARKDDPSIQDLPSLSGKRVGTLAASLAFEMLQGHAEIVLYEGVEEPYRDLVLGRTDAVLLDDIIATRYGAPKPELREVADVGTGHYAMALRPADRDLGDALDRAIAAVIARGELRAILERSMLYGPRQERIAKWTDADQAALVGPPAIDRAPAPATTLRPGQVVLFLRGALVTLIVSALAMAVAVPLGVVLALARLYGSRPWSMAAAAYVELYRGTPVLLQLYLLYYGLAPILRLDAMTAAVLGLGMNYAAYEAEVYRAGLQAVPKAQLEAAFALGMPLSLALRRVLLPQAVRHALPNVTNDFIALLKDSSLVSVITVVELTKQMTITAVDVRTWMGPGILCAFLYFCMSYPLGVLSRRLERRLEGART